ncbi:MAG: hypothetical protein KJ566_03645 [Nanoarchaeota archaeon]|nr:hypothetical protein [Nanoarchaeota archaeon]
MNFIKKVFDGNCDEDVHLQFQKFSKGEFDNRALIRAKCSGKKCTINTSAEFGNELVKILAEKLGEQKTKISGAIVSTADLTGELEFKEKKQFQGVKRYLIENEMSGKELLGLLAKFPKAFFGLSFEVGEEKLKIKPKAPKSSKAKNKDDSPKADFCKLITRDEEIKKSFVFDVPEFKSAEINHTFLIEGIEIPEELKNSKDFALIREKSLRVGKVIRKTMIDGKEVVNEKELKA